MQEKFKEFVPTSWAIRNRITIFLLTGIIVIAGIVSFNILPKENFPEIQFPVIYVSAPYPGTSASDIENLVTRKIEKELKGIDGIKEINSTSVQDFSMVFVEFETGVDLIEAKREVQEAVDRSKSELPGDLPQDPQVVDINLSEIPVMFINVSGPFDNVTLKKYADDIKDELEELKEIRRVDIVGAPERQIQVNVDLYKIQAASITLGNIESAISGENVIISGGELDMADQRVAVRLDGEFHNVRELENLVVRGDKGNIVYLRDVATIVDGFKDRESYARLDGQPVMTLNVIKKAGENLVDASEKIKDILADFQANEFPDRLDITISGDQSVFTNNTLDELTNTIIIGFILVTLVLMFFMGVRDALFVGLAVPLSSFIAFATLPALGFTMNLVVLFSFILAMGIVVDNAIVVIENTYRLYTEEGMTIVKAAKFAAGEVVAPVFSGTLTTIAPFLPLLFWDGTVGEFMSFMPRVMIITLFASLFVAYIINPVFAVTFMRRKDPDAPFNYRRIWIYFGGAVLVGIVSHLLGNPAFGNLLFFMAVFVVFHAYVLRHAIDWFQQKGIQKVKRIYRSTLRWSLQHPLMVFGGVSLVIILTIVGLSARGIKFIQFPEPDPNFVYVYNEMPNGTRVEVTDSVTRLLEERVYETIGENNPIVQSVITNVAIGAEDANSFGGTGATPHRSKITVEFVPVRFRNGVSTREILDEVRENVKGIVGSKVTVGQEASGPPGSAPVEIKVTSEEFGDLMSVSEDLLTYLDSLEIAGVEKFKWDVDEKRPEVLLQVNRQKASELGLSTGQIGVAIRTALFGKDISTFRDREDEYDIVLRLDKKYRQDLSELLNMVITFRDMASGDFRSIPISAVADVQYASSYGGINRTDLEKSVTITTNVLTEYNVNDVFAETQYWVNQFRGQGRIASNVNIEVGGQTIDQAEEGAFLGLAFGAALLLIFLILVTQFNSLSNVLILLSQVGLSTVGVFIGHAVTGMDFSVPLSGVALVTLAGIVVNNGIILIDFFNIQRRKGIPLREAIIEGGATRFTPVMLTATSTILGLVPLALSFNINFGSLLSSGDPQIFFGGDSSFFWKPFSVSIIFGLGFATIITLLVIPVIFFKVKQIEAWFARKFSQSRKQVRSKGQNGYRPVSGNGYPGQQDPESEAEAETSTV